jgi:hypothetical protein
MKKSISGLVPLGQLIKGRIYKITCRNLSYGVYDGQGGFIGIRQKFDDRYLFTEYHWDYSEHCGTVQHIVDTQVDIPSWILIADSMPCTYDHKSGRGLYSKKDLNASTVTWYYSDTHKEVPRKQNGYPDCQPRGIPNWPLFNYLNKHSIQEK